MRPDTRKAIAAEVNAYTKREEEAELRRLRRKAVNHLCMLIMATSLLIVVTRSYLATLPSCPSLAMEIIDLHWRL